MSKAPFKFHIIHSEDIPPERFGNLGDILNFAITKTEGEEQAAAIRAGELRRRLAKIWDDTLPVTQQSAEAKRLDDMASALESKNRLYPFRQTRDPKLLASLELFLRKQGIRKLAHLASGTESLICDMTDDQVLRIVPAEAPRFSAPEAIEPYTTLFSDDGKWKAQVLPKGDYETLDFLDADGNILKEKLDRVNKAYVEPITESLIARGAIFADFLGRANLHLAHSGRVYIGDPGEASRQVLLIHGKENWDNLPPSSFHQGSPDKSTWTQVEDYPLSASGKIAGIISDKDLAAMRAGKKISFLRSDGSMCTPRLGNKKNAFLDLVEKDGLYPLQALRQLGIDLEPTGMKRHAQRVTGELSLP